MQSLAANFAREVDDSVERRSDHRQRTILRVGIINDGRRSTFCLVKNISPSGVQVKNLSPIELGQRVTIVIGDGDPIQARLIWNKGQLAGLQFEKKLTPDVVLRAGQTDTVPRRRASPRVNLTTCATLRTGGRTYSAKLRDISFSGAKLETTRPVPALGTGMLAMPNLPSLQIYIRWTDACDLGVTFHDPLPVEVLALCLDERLHVGVS